MSVWIIGSNEILDTAFFHYFNDMDIPLRRSGENEVDITNYEQLQEFIQEYPYDYWVYCPDYNSHLQENSSESHQLILQGIKNLVRAANWCKDQNIKVKLLYFTNQSTFDGLSSGGHKEEETLSSIDTNSQLNFKAEQYITKHLPSSLIFRLSWLFDFQGENFLLKVLDQMKKNEVIYMKQNDSASPTYARDVTDWAWTLRDQMGIFHLCNSESVSCHEFAQEIARQARQLGFQLNVKLIEELDTKEISSKNQCPKMSRLNTEKAQSYGLNLRHWQEALWDCLSRIKDDEPQL